jgi:hypothetical protein
MIHKRRQRNTYSYLYNGAFRHQKKRATLNDWICTRFTKAKDFTSRFLISKHILTLAHTQTLGGKLDQTTVESARAINRLCVLGHLISLRRLQRQIIKYLWRPNGVLYHRYCPREMLRT